jgi:hypothetical protein
MNMGSMLSRLAPVTTSGVGSLPFIHAAEAARHAVCAYELPFGPQLPRAYGDVVGEWLGAMALEPAGPSLTGVPAMAGEGSLWPAAAVSDQVRSLAELGLDARVMVDEPGLMAAHRAGATPPVWDALRAAAPA